jgi:hypothetical protein
LAREAACQPYDKAAAALREDWQCEMHAKQVQRYAQKIGAGMLAEREFERLEADRGRGPRTPVNAPQLLVIQADGGRVHTTEINPKTGKRWREDKVGVVVSYQPGDDTREPQPLVKTHIATMAEAETFGRHLRVEAERRGVTRAREAIVLGDGGNWIDSVAEREFPGLPRVIDWYHALEHLHACRRALYANEDKNGDPFVERLKDHLWRGDVQQVIRTLRKRAKELGPPTPEDGDEHPRRVLARNVNYFQNHAKHMDYAAFRARGWPIGSGIVEAGVKQFNKRVKGTEQSWNISGVEPILALRAAWLSEDERWNDYWDYRPAYRRTWAA